MNYRAGTQEEGYGFVFNFSAVVQELEEEKLRKDYEALIAEENAEGEQDEPQDEPQELDGWIINPKQCALITLGNREAIDKFFEQNDRRLRALIYAFRRRQGYLTDRLHTPYLTDEDCYNQAYLDMRRGFLYFEMKPRAISKLLYHSFTYAAVGGFGEEDGRYRCELRAKQGVRNVNP